MNAISYSRLTASLFAIIAVLQFIRAVGGWQIVVNGTTSVPVWPSWIACVVAAGLAWIGFDASRRGLSGERTDRPDRCAVAAGRHCPGMRRHPGRVATPSLVLTAKAFTPIHTPAVGPVAAQGRYHQHADAVCPASWTAPHSYLTGPVARWELAGLAGLRGHAVRLMKRHG